MSRLIILTGKSSSGKSYAQDRLVTYYGFKPLVLCTTRPMRPNENQGIDYLFITEDAFKKRIEEDRFVYYATFNAYAEDMGELQTWYYGLSKYQLNCDTVVVTDIDNVKKIRDYYEGEGNDVEVVMLNVDEETREQRARNRQGDKFSMDEWIRRLMDETRCYSVDKINRLVDTVIDNTDPKAIDKYMGEVDKHGRIIH